MLLADPWRVNDRLTMMRDDFFEEFRWKAMSVNGTGNKPAIRTYGVAGKWANGNTPSRTAATAADLFMGPATKGTDWGAAFATTFGSNQDLALQDYVKRNYDKFNGGVLQAMLEQTGLIDWYKNKMAEEAKKISASLEETLKSVDEIDFGSLLSDRAKDILANLEKPRPSGAFSNGAAAGSVVDISV